MWVGTVCHWEGMGEVELSNRRRNAGSDGWVILGRNFGYAVLGREFKGEIVLHDCYYAIV